MGFLTTDAEIERIIGPLKSTDLMGATVKGIGSYLRLVYKGIFPPSPSTFTTSFVERPSSPTTVRRTWCLPRSQSKNLSMRRQTGCQEKLGRLGAGPSGGCSIEVATTQG